VCAGGPLHGACRDEGLLGVKAGVAGEQRVLERVAIIDHRSAGGVSRFLFALISSLGALYPETTFTYFVAEENVVRDGLVDRFAGYDNVVVRAIRRLPAEEAPAQPLERGAAWNASVGLLKRAPRVHAALRDSYVAVRGWFAPQPAPPEPAPWFIYDLDEEVRAALDEHDVAYFGWPYFIEPFDTDVPLVATFHDLHFKHFPHDYDPLVLETVEQQTPEWISRCAVAVCSSEFIRADLQRYYGDILPSQAVVYLAPYGIEKPSASVVDETLAAYGIARPFVLYSGALTPHKNVATLLQAIAALRDAGTPVPLVITGHGTDVLERCDSIPEDAPVRPICRVIEERGLRLGEDFMVLGYVSDADVDALTAAASAIVAPSRYEAGCGPALDAWQMGVPVVFSGIPPFLEQLEHLGTEAYVFDPDDASGMAEMIRTAVFDEARSKGMAERSLEAIARSTWDDTARGYYEAFLKAVERNENG
jgi:glycosyltransferase involved in cell wall biosynthesis